jgi:hypothetical protein
MVSLCSALAPVEKAKLSLSFAMSGFTPVSIKDNLKRPK